MTCTGEKLGVLLQSQMARGVCSVGFIFWVSIGGSRARLQLEPCGAWYYYG